MAIWVIADLHLSFGVPDKGMEVFGENWKNHDQKIEWGWRELIAEDDLVLIPGDISWALRLEDARPDLEWIGNLPGTKVIIRGNHDLWWSSLSKIKTILPPSCHLIQNNAYNWQDVTIAGARLWDVPGLEFKSIIRYQENKRANALTAVHDQSEAERIYLRELGRLETSLKAMNPKAKLRIAMTHYPPIGLDGQATEASKLLEKYKVDICVFGHLHNVMRENPLFGTFRGVQYYLTSCDYLEDFKPIRIG